MAISTISWKSLVLSENSWGIQNIFKGLSWGVCCVLNCFTHIQLFVTLWTIAHQAPLTMGFSRHEYWSGLPCPPPGDQSDPGIKPTSLTSPSLQVDSWSLAPPRKPGIEECFKIVTIGKFIAIIISSLQVNLSFSSAQGLPASNTNLKVTAAPYSLCGLRAVDQSVLLMKPEAELSPQSVSPISVSDIRKCTHDMTFLEAGSYTCKGQVL